MAKGYYSNVYTKLLTLFLFTVEDETDLTEHSLFEAAESDLNYRMCW